MPFQTKWTKDVAPLIDKVIADAQENDVYPSTGTLIKVYGIVEQTLYNWAGKHPDVRDALARLREAQRVWLETHGLDPRYNARFAQFLLSARHGYREKTEQDVTLGQDADRPFKVEVKVDI